MSHSRRVTPRTRCRQKDRFIGGGLAYPYVEGLRLDEAMHPLTLLTVGVYGKALPPQNGAPIRLTVPWKYGFKGIKSIVSIKLTRERPPNMESRRAGRIRFLRQREPTCRSPTLVAGDGTVYRFRRGAGCEASAHAAFNGYADEVASLYRGLNLRENF